MQCCTFQFIYCQFSQLGWTYNFTSLFQVVLTSHLYMSWGHSKWHMEIWSTRLRFYAVVLFGNTLELKIYADVGSYTQIHTFGTPVHTWLPKCKLIQIGPSWLMWLGQCYDAGYLACGQRGHGNGERSCQLYMYCALNHIKDHSISPQHPTGACMV